MVFYEGEIPRCIGVERARGEPRFQKSTYSVHGVEVDVTHNYQVPESLKKDEKRRIVILFGSAPKREQDAWIAFDELDSAAKARIAVLAVALDDNEGDDEESKGRKYLEWLRLLGWLESQIPCLSGTSPQEYLVAAASANAEMARICGLKSHEVVVRELAALRLAALFLAGDPGPEFIVESKVAERVRNRSWKNVAESARQELLRRAAIRAEEERGSGS